MNILIIGGGTMGLTYVQSFLRARIATSEQIMLLEKTPERAAELAKLGLCAVYDDPALCLPKADLLLMAVKPQDTPEAMRALRPYTEGQQVVLSIMAGVTLETLRQGLGLDKIVRAMPNLPVQIGLGATAFTATEAVSRVELVLVQNLLNTTGKTTYVQQEDLVDAATAVSGSGTAYVYYFMQALIAAAEHRGFSRSESELLVVQTFKGAVDLYERNNLSCQDWIKRVASKGGTTEAALAAFAQGLLDQAISQGVEAAYQRAKDLALPR